MNYFSKKIKYILFFVLAAGSFSSCIISSRSNMDVFNKSEYASSVSIKTIKVPLLLTKPFLKTYLRKEEEAPKEVRDLISSLKKVRVTLAKTKNQDLVKEFRSSAISSKGEEWVSVRQGNRWVYIKAQQEKENIIERFMVAVSDPDSKQLVYVNVKCHLTVDQLSSLINYALNDGKGKENLTNK